MRSMTGFATTNVIITRPNASKSTVTLSLKSLNSRYFEVTCKLPHQLQMLETELIALFKEHLHRGHIYFSLYVSNSSILKGNIEPSLASVDQYYQAITQIQNRLALSGELSIDAFITLPNIFIEQEQPIDDEIKQHILDAVHPLIEQVIKAQEQEGDRLKVDIVKRIGFMKAEIKKIEEASGKLIEAQKQKVHETMKELEFQESKFAEAQKNALYAVLDKIDIHEEIIRFKSHLDNISAQLQEPTIEKGKRLDFTLQELGREINTITAKCSDAHISSMAINIKVELEKAREQIQNII